MIFKEVFDYFINNIIIAKGSFLICSKLNVHKMTQLMSFRYEHSNYGHSIIFSRSICIFFKNSKLVYFKTFIKMSLIIK